MPTYKVDIPEQGSFEVNSETALTDMQAYEAAKSQKPVVPDPTAMRERGLATIEPPATLPKSKSSEALKTVSNINTHIADTLGMPVDTVNAVLNMAGIGSKKPALGSQNIKESFQQLGISEGEKPETPEGKMAASLVGGGVEAALTGGGVGGAVKMAGERFAMPALKAAGASFAEIEPNVVAGAGGGFGGEAAKEATGGNALAEVGGNILGGGLAGFAKGGTKAINDAVISAYERLGLVPSIGEALAKEGVMGRSVQWLQGNSLPQTLGGGGVMERFKTKRMKELNDKRVQIAEAFGDWKSREKAGTSMQDEVMDTWSKRKTTDGELIGNLSAKFGNDVLQPVELISALATPVGAPTSKAIRERTVDPLVNELNTMLSNMASGGKMTFKDLAGLKTYVGDKLEPGVVPNVNDAQVSQIFNAIRDDMAAHIKNRSPEDFIKLQQSRERYAKAMEEFRHHFKKLLTDDKVHVKAERVYDIVTGAAGEKGQADLAEFRNVWDVLSPTTRGDLASNILIRLGATNLSNPENVETWSLGKFLSGYRNNLSLEAKDMLFNKNKDVRKDLDALVTIVDNIQTKLTRLESTSKSGAVGVHSMQGGLSALGLYEMSPKGLMLMLAAMGGPYAAAEMLTNPKAVKATMEALLRVNDAIDASIRAGLEIGAIPKMHPQQQRGNLQQYGAKDLQSARNIGLVGEHADWAKFESRARPSENVEDYRFFPSEELRGVGIAKLKEDFADNAEERLRRARLITIGNDYKVRRDPRRRDPRR